MKTRHHLWAALLLIITLLAACKDENPFDKNFVPRRTAELPKKQQQEDPYLTVSPTELSFGSAASSETVTVSTNATTAYTISSSVNWLTATASSDRKTLTVSVAENTATSSRTGTITLAVSGLTATIAVTQSAGSAPSGGDPEAVDLGLPSGTKWANMNVGASSPEDYGLYFAWGETVGYGSDTSDGHSFDMNSYKYRDDLYSLTKYCTDTNDGTVDNKTTLDLSDDAAYVNWGSTWRMPSFDEIKELLDNTTSTWTTLNGVHGRLFTSMTNSNSIFMPSGGVRTKLSLNTQETSGHYWSSSLRHGYSDDAEGLICSENSAINSWGHRELGRSVRPVLNSTYLIVSSNELGFGSAASSETVTVSTNVSTAYTISSSADWLTATTSSDRKTLTVSVAGNTTTSSRTGTITLAVSGLTATIAVTQQAGEAYLTVSSNELKFGSAASSETVTVNTNVSDAYSISSSADWLTATASSDRKTLTVSVAGNTTTSSRTGTITLASGELTATIAVTQQAGEAYLTVSSNELNFGSGASSKSVTVNTNVTTAYTISSSAAWLTATTSSDRKTLTVSVAENTATSSRTGTITLAVSGLTAAIAVTQSAGSAPSGGDPEAIDLGLPSGTKWANMNVGASSPEDYGLYFAWGETVGYGSDTSDGHSFDWASYKYCNGSASTMTKYCTTSSYGTVDNKTTLDLSDDAAYVNWGSSWRMPTYDEIRELLDNTTSTWTSVNGVSGRRFTSKTNGNSIFLPAAGYRYGSSSYQGALGHYCSSSLDTSNSFNARYLNFNSDGAYAGYYYRCSGQSVRPVLRN